MSENILIFVTSSECPKCRSFKDNFIDILTDNVEKYNINFKVISDIVSSPGWLQHYLDGRMLPCFVIMRKDLFINDEASKIRKVDVNIYDDHGDVSIDIDDLLRWINTNMTWGVYDTVNENIGYDEIKNIVPNIRETIAISVNNSHIFTTSRSLKL